MKTFVGIIAVLALIVLFGDVAMAQPGMPGAPTQSPIDGGLGLLALAGGAYAVKKMRSKK